MDLRLDDKVVLVTGGSRGIGKAIATECAQSGAKVMITARKREELEKAVVDMPGEAAIFAGNVGSPDDAHECVAATLDRFGRLDVLVNNAATNPYFGPLIDADLPR